MPALKLRDDLHPVTDLKSRGTALVRQVEETGRAVVLSRHGRAAAVLLSVDEYEDLCELRDMVAARVAVAEADAAVAAGDVVPQSTMQEKFARLLLAGR